MGDRYFAYGSNLCLARMLERVPSATGLGPARLAGYRMVCDKRGADGSGKANLHPAPGGETWGVVYDLDAASWPRLDAFESRYERIGVVVELAGYPVEASTYRSDWLTREPVAFDWYKGLIVDGAREHGLPEPYRHALDALPSRPDPSRS